ncbi:MAG: hypothetical protein Kow0019_08800 [Methanobacteriaceae archaeon]
MNYNQKAPKNTKSIPSTKLVTKNITRLRGNTFGFYTIKGHSTINFKDQSRKENIIEFLNR